MTQDNTYQLPKLYIDDIPISADVSGTISFRGNSQLINANIFVSNTDIQFQSLFNKPIKLYLKSNDSVPIFRGFIKNYIASESGVNITALDVRMVLSGNEGAKVNITDDDNFDGYTLGQFLFKYITDNINVTNTVIGLKFINDSNPRILLNNTRVVNQSIYSVVSELVDKGIDTTDVNHPLTFFLDVIDDGINSNIVIVKEKHINSIPSYTFSYTDGLEYVNFNRRLSANTVYYKGGAFQYSNRPQGQVVTEITEKEDRAENKRAALEQVLLNQQQSNEITIGVNKCYDIGLGTIIRLDVEDEDIRGSHRVQSKTLSFGKSSKCVLQLNKAPPKLSDYL